MMQTSLLMLTLALPLRHLQVTSAYGNRIHPVTGQYCLHAGVDLKANDDTVYAIFKSRVIATGYGRGIGAFIKIANGPFVVTYGHLSQLFVLPDDSIATAVPIGISGQTGQVTGPHLHFAMQYHGHYIDPLAFLAAGFQMNH